jgi:hypothetical protein
MACCYPISYGVILIPHFYLLEKYKKKARIDSFIVGQTTRTQHIKPLLLLFVLVDESRLLPLLSGLEDPCKSSEKLVSSLA